MRINSTFIRRVLPLVVCSLLSVQQLAASQSSFTSNAGTESQQGQFTLSGRVTDASGAPVIGATVLITDTASSGTFTDVDGAYSLSVSQGQTLEFSMMGFVPQLYTVSTANVYNVILEEDAVTVDDVVVTALGIKRSEKALSYNVQQVNADDVTKVRDANLVNALSGKVVGVNINSGSSGTGGASKVVMRGTKSIEQSSNALYVIDGVPMYNFGGSGSTSFGSNGATEAVADINSDDIESISVLTGAAAAALYGSNAANGAIIITTKKGSKGRVQVSLSSNTEVSSALVMPEFQNTYGTGNLSSSVDNSYLSWGSKLQSDQLTGYNPKSDYLQNGIITTETISLSAGNDRSQTYASAGAINSKGIVENNEYDRYNFTIRNTTELIKDKMTLDAGASYILQNDQNMVNQGIYANPIASAYLFPRGDDWSDIQMFERYDSSRKIYTQYWPSGSGNMNLQNPYWINYRNLRTNEKQRYMFNASLSYQVLDWLNVSGRIRVDNSVNDFEEKYYATSDGTILEGSENGLYGLTTTKNRQTYGDLLVNINKRLSDDLTLTANIGGSFSSLYEDQVVNSGPISNSGGVPNVFNLMHLDDTKSQRGQYGWREQTQSVFANVELGYKDTFFLTATARNDWPSQLAGANSSQSSFFYPSVGGSILVSELFEMPEQLNYLKVRGSFASVGLPFPRFIANPTYEWDNTNKIWTTKTIYPMYDLKPEKTNSWEIGLTARFLKHFNLDASYYNAKTFNQTFDPEISVSSGYSTMYVQTGNVQNRGLEISLGYDNKWERFSWGSTFLFSTNQNKILELVDNYVHPETGEVISKDRLMIGSAGQAQFILKEGGTLGDLYSVVDFLRDDNGNIYVGKSDSGTDEIYTTSTDDIYLGSVLPKANLSWRNDFKFDNFGLGFMVSARLGGVVYSYTQAMLDLYGVSAATAEARDAGGVSINGGDMIDSYAYYSVAAASGGLPQNYIYSATNARLQEAYVSYTFPRKMLGDVVDLTVSVVGRNLFMIYCKAPFDPESVASTENYYQGVDMFIMPSTRNVGFNVQLKF